MKKIFIHAGFHKTGTTYIQEFLKKNRNALLPHVYYYLDEAYIGTFYSNHTLAASIRDVEHPEITISETDEAVWSRFIASVEKSECDTVLVSSEVFMEGVNLSFLKEVLNRFELTFVFYVRRQDDFFESAYTERIKHGGTESITDFFEKVKLGGYDLFSRIRAFENGVPGANIIVREYNRKLFPTGNIVRDLLNSIDVPFTETQWCHFQEVNLMNQRWSSKSVELMRQFNMLPVSHKEIVKFRNYLMELFRREPELSRLPLFSVDNELKQRILELSTESNLKLVKSYIRDGDFFSEESLGAVDLSCINFNQNSPI